MRAFIASALLVLTSLGIATADEVKVAVSEVPVAGLEAAKALFPAASVSGAAKETENGKTFYEITLKHKGKTIDVTVGLDGALQWIEKEIDPQDLPKAVQATLEEKYPKAAYKIIEEVSTVKNNKPRLDFFEVLLVTAEKKELEIQIAADGKIKNVEQKSEQD
jgi:hypothetical protein